MVDARYPLAFVDNLVEVVQPLARHHHGGERARAGSIRAHFDDEAARDPVRSKRPRLTVREVDTGHVEVLIERERGVRARHGLQGRRRPPPRRRRRPEQTSIGRDLEY